MRNQVKAKKQNIVTLEELLKENSHRYREPNATNGAQQQAQAPHKPAKLKFFVAGPDGLCVEFTEKAENSVAVLRKEVTQAFVPKRDDDRSCKTVKLVYKGALLLDERSIDHYDIQSGDTVVAVLESVMPVPAAEKTEPATPAKDTSLSEMIEFLGRQQEAMREFAHDIKLVNSSTIIFGNLR